MDRYDPYTDKFLRDTQYDILSTDLATKRTIKGFPIDADLLMLKVEEEFGFRARDTLYEIIRNMPKYELPSTQPEIIYCKDCKWKNRHNCTRAVEVFIDDDKYCAWAERRTDE